MKNVRPEKEVDEILRSLHEGLKQAERSVSTILAGIVADNALYVTELEAALSDMEATLAAE